MQVWPTMHYFIHCQVWWEQFGFLKGMSTAIVNYCKFCTTLEENYLDSKCQVDTLYLDFAKAFHKVSKPWTATDFSSCTVLESLVICYTSYAIFWSLSESRSSRYDLSVPASIIRWTSELDTRTTIFLGLRKRSSRLYLDFFTIGNVRNVQMYINNVEVLHQRNSVMVQWVADGPK